MGVPVIDGQVARGDWGSSFRWAVGGADKGRGVIGQLLGLPVESGGAALVLAEEAVTAGVNGSVVRSGLGGVWWCGVRLPRGTTGVTARMRFAGEGEEWGAAVAVVTSEVFGRGMMMRALLARTLTAGGIRVVMDVWGRPALVKWDEAVQLEGELVEIGAPRFTQSQGGGNVARLDTYEADLDLIVTADDVSVGQDRLDQFGTQVRGLLDRTEGLGIGMGVVNQAWTWSAREPAEASRLVSQRNTLRVPLGRRWVG